MNKSINLWPEKAILEKDIVKFFSTLEFPDGSREEIWYKIPADLQQEITELADPFVVASLFLAMSSKNDLRINCEVSSRLLENLEEYQTIWQCWKPEVYKKVELFADQEIKPPTNKNCGAIIPFSGGVDSCFSVYSHINRLRGRKNKNIEAALMVHGFDIPLSATEKFRLAARKSAEMLEDVGVPLICISTNWRELQYKYKLDWVDCHPTAIIAALMLFQKEFRYGLFALGDMAYKKITWGSNPLCDPLLSSDSMTVILDGSEYSRVEKVALINNWEKARKNLRVCWEGKDYEKNCGVCEKCIRTILDFRVTGGNLPECFENDVNNNQILRVPIKHKVIAENFESIVELAKANGMAQQSWVKALTKRIRWYYSPPPLYKINKWKSKIKKKLSSIPLYTLRKN